VYNRKYLLIAGAFLWTVSTALSVICVDFWSLLATRISFAVFMSIDIPASVSLITDLYDHDMLGRANSVFCFGVYLGVGLSSLSIIFDDEVGWKNAMLIVSAICLMLAFTLFLLKEPRK